MKPEERKEQILSSAKKLFSHHGFYDTQISDIIQEAGIARGTFYQYFNSKEDIFRQLLEIFFHDFKKVLFSTVNGEASLSYRNFFIARIKRAFEYFDSDREICSIVFRKAIGLPTGLELGIRRLEKLGTDYMKQELKTAMDRGILMKDLNIDIVSNIIAGAFSRTAYDFFSVEDKDSYPEGLDNLSENFINVFIDGLAAPGISSRK